MGVGDARVVVPDDVCVATDAHVRVGEIRTFERSNDGVDVDLVDRPNAPAGVTRLLVKADLGVGSLQIGRSGADLDLDHGQFDLGPSPEFELGRNSACAA
jgi:hypothetical protein